MAAWLKNTCQALTEVIRPPLFGEAAGLVHPRVDRDHRHRAEDAAERDRHPGPQVRPARQAPPAVQVDRGEDGLQEEEQPLDTEREPEHRPVLPHQPRPQQAHLERQHRAGHRADRDQHAHRLRPAPRQPHRGLVMAPQADELGQQHDRRERDPQARQDDVEPERGRHLRTGRDHLTAGMRSSNHNRGIKTHYSSLKVRRRHCRASRNLPGIEVGEVEPQPGPSSPATADRS